jgi:hypothetical protein
VWIVPANAVHTVGMLFTFDLVLIDKNFKVVGLRELVRPFTITKPNFKAERCWNCQRTRFSGVALRSAISY